MVAVIHASSSLNNALNYNEQKVKQGHGECLLAVNYPKDVEELNFYQKLCRLTNQAALNQRAKVKSVHISLNFDPSEKLPATTLKEIASVYMEKIGFGKQPYLVYEHRDAGHPHLHIVTTNIQANGRRIELHNIGRNQSEKARKEIEISFGLVQADRKKMKQAYELKPVNAQKIQYGKSETRRAITNVLDAVLNNYKYTSLHELNAVLKLYNLMADRGSEDSRTYQKHGLVYRVLDSEGNKTSVPIKASLIYSNPTLKFLESKFQQNESAKQPHKQRIKNVIDWTLLKTKNISMQNLKEKLEKERIHVAIRQNKEGIIYGITYVDHQTKCVFNGSDLGMQYSAKGVMERCNINPSLEQIQNVAFRKHRSKPISKKQYNSDTTHHSDKAETSKVVDALITPIATNNYVPYQLKRSKKKKKRKRLQI